MADIITIQEATAILNYRDHRSVIAWCKRHQVVVMSDSGGKRKYMLRVQFDLASLKPFIKFLQLKYRQDWFNAFKIYTDMGITRVVELEEMNYIAPSVKIEPPEKSQYNPTSEHEIRFLASLSKEK